VSSLNGLNSSEQDFYDSSLGMKNACCFSAGVIFHEQLGDF